MAKELLVNVSRGEEVRVALVEDGRLEEIYLERDSAASNVGNIYLGKVTNVESSIQAAFVDFGYGRNGFLHVQDLHPDYFPEGGRWDRMQERVGMKIGRRDRPPIQDCLRRGDQIIVQIIKEGIGTKGPTLTSYPSIPGRFLVMMPGVAQMGVSKNIEDEDERRRLRKVLDGLKPPKEVGFIIRTAGMGKAKLELERDFKYLTRLHEQIEQHRKHAKPPALLYSEGDLVTRTVRDVWTGDVERVICDDAETALRIKQFFRLLMPRTKVNVQLYQGQVPLFHAAGVEAEIETMFSRHVPLPSGGSLVIDSTEAVVAIDVNSGKFRVHDDAEETAYRIDMEAAEEICRQLRLRDLGGVVICDFIDLRYSRHREALFNHLTELFKRDKAKSRHLPMNEFGIVSVTRQRMRPDLKKSVFMPCPWSGGTGYIKTPESMALDVMRRLRVAAADDRVRQVNVRLFPTVALHVLNTKRQALADLERQSGKAITVRQDDSLAADEIGLELLDERDGQVQVESLRAPVASEPDSGGRRKRRRRRRKGEEPATAGTNGKAHSAADDDEDGGLIDLPDLLELGELKLEAVEELVGALTSKESATRDSAVKDPRELIVEALRSGSLYEEDEAEDAADAAPRRDGGRQARRADAGAEDEDVAAGRDAGQSRPREAGQEEAVGGRRGRRRRRGRGQADAPAGEGAPRWEGTAERDDESNESVKSGNDSGHAAREPAKALQFKDDDDEATFASGPEAGRAEGAPGEGEGGRRRRRRRRRGRGGDRAVEADGRAAAQPAANDEAESPALRPPQRAQRDDDRDDRSAPPTRGGDGRRPAGQPQRGSQGPSKTQSQSHAQGRAREDGFDRGAAGESRRGEGGGRRGRRGRKGRGMRSQQSVGPAGAQEGGPASPLERLRAIGLSDDQLDQRINGNRVPSGNAPRPVAGVFRETEDDDAGDATPAQATPSPVGQAGEGESGETGEGGRRRRRRRRRRGRGGNGEAREAQPAVAPLEEHADAAAEVALLDEQADVEVAALPDPLDLDVDADTDAADELELAEEGLTEPAEPVKASQRRRVTSAKKLPVKKSVKKAAPSAAGTARAKPAPIKGAKKAGKKPSR